VVEAQTAASIEGFRGALLAPGDEGYDEARFTWNRMFDKHPALIARCSDVADVIAGVDYARENDLLLSVRGGGHSVPGHSTCDDGLLLDLSLMKGVRVDPVARTVRAQGGVDWGTFDHEAQAFGLGTTGGQVSTTGIAGLTLGGGIGWLMRKHGLACDSLISADVVTAAGELVVASPDRNEELFWGLRGGGGNFGVVTSLEYRLHEVGMVFGGAVIHPAEGAADVLGFYREFCATAPEELTTYAIFATAPPAPFIPPEVVGMPIIILGACCAGPIGEAERVLQPLREFGSPAVDLFQPLPYAAMQGMFDETAPAGHSYYLKGDYVPEVSDDLIAALTEQAAAMPGPHCEVHLGQMGGAIRRLGENETAFSHRDAEFMFIAIAHWIEQDEEEGQLSWVRGVGDAVTPHSIGAYVNFLGDEGDARIRSAYGTEEKYDRLVRLKREWDPENLFCLNQNIRP
jgi:FAD/FMN-containing dehydrogenase